MKLSEILREDRVYVKVPFKSKDEVMQHLLNLIGQGYTPETVTKLHDSVYIREAAMSTGIGHGVAIPHGKTEATNGDIEAAMVTLDVPVDWNALDELPVNIVIMFMSSHKRPSLYLQALAHASYLLHRPEVRKQLLEAALPNQIMNIFQNEEL